MSYCAPVARALTPSRSRSAEIVHEADDGSASAAGVTPWHYPRIDAVRQDVLRPSASVATIALPIASASRTVSGVPSQSDGKTSRSKRRRLRPRRAGNRENTNRSPRPSAGREPRAPPAAHPRRRCRTARRDASMHTPRGLDEILVAFRRHQPRHGANGENIRRDAERAPCRGDLLRAPRPAELLERNTEVDDLRALGRNQPRSDHELRRRLRDRHARCRYAGASTRSATFWNHGVSVRLACSCRIAGMCRIAAASRPNVVAP